MKTFTFFILPLFLIGIPVLLTGCQSDIEKLDQTCADLEEVAKMTDDCSKMAKKLESITKSVKQQIDAYGKKSPNMQQQADFANSMSVCTKAYLEIATGTCGKELNKSLLMQE